MLGYSPAAIADQGISSNWSGYVAHRHGLSFASVSATWKQPHVKCRRGRRSFSAMWVGLGGFAYNSQALEQIGTEFDCTRSGRSDSSVWLELIPAPAQTLRVEVHPGDEVAARVVVNGHQVTLGFANYTRQTSFVRTQYRQFVDAGSAEWILEAPSVCGAHGCRSLPLANFGAARFRHAMAQTTDGNVGTIAGRLWHRTKIWLRPRGRRFAVLHGSGTPAGAANPSRLSAGGSSFRVTFARVAVRL
jgi:hypothetical protein